MTEDPDNVEAIFEEFGIQGYERSPEVDKLAAALWQLRREHKKYAEWVYRTDNGRRLVMDYLVPASEHKDEL